VPYAYITNCIQHTLYVYSSPIFFFFPLHIPLTAYAHMYTYSLVS